MIDKRALHRRVEVLNHQAPKPLKSGPVGDLLLKKAIEHKEERKKESDRNIYDMSYEAAGDLINLNRGRILTHGGFGTGRRLGPGRWKYINGKWQNGG